MSDEKTLNEIAPPKLTAELMIDAESPVGEIVLKHGRIQDAKRYIKAWEAQFEAAMIEWIDANGDFEINGVRYYVGPEKKVKCIHLKAALEALMEKCGGDWDVFVGCLSSNALKPGAAREVFGAEFDTHFATTTETDLKTGKPAKGLHVVDTKFLK